MMSEVEYLERLRKLQQMIIRYGKHTHVFNEGATDAERLQEWIDTPSGRFDATIVMKKSNKLFKQLKNQNNGHA